MPAGPVSVSFKKETMSNYIDQGALAENAFAEYEFGDGVMVTDTSGWDYTTPGHERTRKVYVETEPEDDGPAPRWALNFTVRFDSASGALSEAYAMDEKGQIWGSMPDPREVSNYIEQTALSQDKPAGLRALNCAASLSNGLLTLEDGTSVELADLVDFVKGVASKVIPSSNDAEHDLLVEVIGEAGAVLNQSGVRRILSNYIDHPASGKTGTFAAKYDQHAERNGQTFTVLGAVDPSTHDADECGEMFTIRFADGVQIDAWPEEVQSAMNVSNYLDHANESIQDVVDDVLERAKKYGFKPDEDMVREAVEESANLLKIELTETQISEACQRVMNPREVSNYIEQTTKETSVEPGPKLYRAEVHGGGDLDVSPSVAVFQVDEQLARDIIKFASLVKANDVYKIERFDYRAEFLQFDPETAPEDAAQAGEGNSVRTDVDCLVVTESEFFFRAYVKHTDVGVECSGQSVSELAKHFGLQFGEIVAQQSVVDKGLLLRTKALALLQEAQAVDGLKPFTVTHTHSFGESTYVLWAAEKPTQEEAKAVLDSEFEPDREETLVVEDCFSLEEMSGVAVTARLPDILESLQSPGQADSPSP